MIKYIITGLPRSGTTWLSVFLSTDDCVCLHDPFAEYTPEELSKWEGGITDTALWYYDDWCKANTDKFILIKQSKEQTVKKLKEKNLPELPDFIYEEFENRMADKILLQDTLFEEENMKSLWEFIHPDKPFNQTKWIEFSKIYMSPLSLEKLNEK